MRLRRNLFWGVIAFYPLVGLLVVANVVPDSFVSESTTSPTLRFIEKYWFAAFLLTCLAQFAYFIIHAVTAKTMAYWRRALWTVSFLLWGFVATPLYWWFHGKK